MVTLKWFRGTNKKKYKVEIYKYNKKVKTIQFGHKNHEHYRDKTPLKLYSHLNHLDSKRKKNYYSRHNKTYPKYSADYFSKRYLW